MIRQQLPPPQQSAEREVALAVPTSARAATIANRYFMGILQLSFLSALIPQSQDEPTRSDGIRRAAEEREEVASGWARKKCKRQKFRRRPADKQTARRRWPKVRNPGRRGRNIVDPDPTSARAARIREPATPFSFSRSNPSFEVPERAAAAGLPRKRSSKRETGRAALETSLASRFEFTTSSAVGSTLVSGPAVERTLEWRR
jgi:hypothetical protein